MNTRLVYFIAILALFMASGCDSDDGGIVVTPDTTSSFKATIDNNEIEATYSIILQDREFNGYHINDKIVKLQRYVSASDNRGFLIRLDRADLQNMTLPHEFRYNNSADTASLSFFYFDIDNKPWVNNQVNNSDCSLTINSYTNNLLEGVFSGNVYRVDPSDSTQVLKKAIENGSFSIQMKEF